MKIGFLIKYFYPKVGGAENYALNLARFLAKKHEVHVFCSDVEESESEAFGIKIHRSKEILSLSYYLAFYPSLTKKLLSYDLDVIHVIGFGFIQNEMIINKLKRAKPETKIVCTPHGPFMALRKYSLFASTLKCIYNSYLRRHLRKYDLFLEDNPEQRLWMKEIYNIPYEKIRFLPCGLDKDVFDKINKNSSEKIAKKYNFKNRLIISYVGRIQRYKGLDQVIKVLPSIKKLYPNILFVAMGRDADDLSRLQKMALELNVKDNVLFAGEITDEEKLAILDLSEIFLFPSDWEAFGIVILEAMARSNAIISSKTEGGRFLVEEGKNGFLFDYGNIKEFNDKLLILLKDTRLRKKFQENNLRKSKKFLWQDLSNQLEKIYINLLGKSI